jgi:hypothetical protein
MQLSLIANLITKAERRDKMAATVEKKFTGSVLGKKIGCLVGSEFSDFQAYYLASYIGEFGGELEFLCVDWGVYKFTRPNIKTKGVVGMWGLTLDPIPVMEYIYRGAKVTLATFTPVIRSRPPLVGLDVVQGNFGMSVPFQEIPESYYTIKKLVDVGMDDFDAIQIPGAMCPYNIVEAGTPLEFLKQADGAGKIITYICHGGIPVAAADLIKGKKATGWQASKDSIEIMGGEYNENWAAVVDGTHVSGRTPPEIPEYVDAIMVRLLID